VIAVPTVARFVVRSIGNTFPSRGSVMYALRPSGETAKKFPGLFGMSTVASATGGEPVISTGEICLVEPDSPALTTNAVRASGEIATPKPPVPPVATIEPAVFEPKSIGIAVVEPSEASVTNPCHDAASATDVQQVAATTTATTSIQRDVH
jgi:hypothetical protein